MSHHMADGLGMAALVRAGKVSALELVDEAIARVECLNGGLNAVITPMFDSAREQARQPLPPGPFAGVPFLVKDLLVSIPGVPLSYGSAALRECVPTEECAQAKAIREAGFMVLGKTNLSEFGSSPLTNPVAFGPTGNPWNPALNSGGSSGGSTAAVAARMVPMASSTDGGGSIRIPAAFCGVFGFKPSRGRNEYDPTDAWGGAVVSHATTLSVRDSAAYLDWTSARLAVTDPERPPPGSYAAHARSVPGLLRIALCLDSPAGGTVHRDCLAATENAARLLERLGHEVIVCPLPYDGRALLRAFLTVIAACTARDLPQVAHWLGKPMEAVRFELATDFIAEAGRGVGPERFAAALAVWRQTGQTMRDFHAAFDVVLSPATATPPLPHDALDPRGVDRCLMVLATRLRVGRHLFGRVMLDQAIARNLSAIPFTPLANATGQPSMSVPLHWTRDGLPVGVLFTADVGRDGLLFSLAAQLEAAQPWRRRLPPMVAACEGGK